MAAEQRKLLEQLMGDDMNSATTKTLSITDPKVCRSFLCGSCPHDLFTNTKQDIGTCPKSHAANLREEYQSASEAQKQDWGFEWDYQADISKYINECDRRIDQSHKRLEKTPEEIRQTNALMHEIDNLKETIDWGMIEVEALAELGSVNLAVLHFHNMNLKKIEKEEKERELKAITETSGPSGHQKLQVCDVCGAFLSRLDNDRRLADHFFGKMHLGYAQMRKEGERLSQELKGRAPPRHEDPSFERGGYDEYGGGRRDGYGGGYGRGGGGGYGGRGGGFGRRGGGGGGYGQRW